MLREFKLPDLGEGIHEGEVRSVLVTVGQRVDADQPVLEVETDKVAVEMTSPWAGVVQALNVQAGQTAHVGDVLITFDVPEQAGAEPAAPAPSEPEAAPAEPTGPAPQPAGTGGNGPGRQQGPVPATPVTRRIARELGIDLHQVTPSGPGGRVTSEDVQAFAQQLRTATKAVPEPQPAPAAPAAPETRPEPAVSPPAAGERPEEPDFSAWGPIERVALQSVRRATARHLALSWAQIPHVHHMDSADITQLEAYRQRFKAEVEKQGGRLSLTVFVLKAACVALKEFPGFNASYDSARAEVIYKRYYNLGVATDTERGLVVPVIHEVDRKSIAQLANELVGLTERVRAGGASVEDMRGGSFTVTNIGALGGTSATPIINYPESAILGLGAARWQPVVIAAPNEQQEPEIAPRLMLPLFLGFDHRVADGVEAARFVGRLVEILENPDRLALWI